MNPRPNKLPQRTGGRLSPFERLVEGKGAVPSRSGRDVEEGRGHFTKAAFLTKGAVGFREFDIGTFTAGYPR